jgi:hemerythrin-like metal-binding protein
MEYRWDESLETGHTLIDEQHKQLFVALVNLIEASKQGSGKDEIYKTLDFLCEYTVMHFKTEEDLQIEYGYPDYSLHKQSHDEFKTTVSNLIYTLQQKGPKKELVDMVVQTVADWLFTHIKGNDTVMAAFLKSQGAMKKKNEKRKK